MDQDFSKIPTAFDVTIYGNLEPVNETISKSRVRIFYKGMNRNRTFISEDFANQLIASLPYTPVKGIFNKDAIDYEDHGEDNTDGRIYGIVPADPNFAWEDHVDEDGVTRTYACADVFLFTGLYPEAKLIPGESQSMEIFRGNLKGEWRISEEDNQPYYHFLSGCLVGLQVLGEEVEPCFEGAAFYNLRKEVQELVDYINNFSKKEEKAKMDKTLFRISDNQKADILFDLINPNFNEEGGWQLDGIVTEVYDDYALCVSPTGYKRVYYTKDGDNISIGESVEVQIVDVTTSEYAALEAMKAIGGTYEEANTSYNNAMEKINELEQEKAHIQEKFNEAADQLAHAEGFPTEEFQKRGEKIEALEAEKVEMEQKISDITSENESLVAFKKAVEKSQKEAILTKYEEYLTESAITNFQSEMDNYSVEDFKKEVCTAAVEADPTFFNNRHGEPEMFYKGGNPDGGKTNESPVVRLLNQYKNGGNK